VNVVQSTDSKGTPTIELSNLTQKLSSYHAAFDMHLFTIAGTPITIARSLNDEDLIIQNSTLIQSTVTNHTWRDNFYRVRTQVGVAYGSDLATVMNALTRTACEIPGRSDKREPTVLLLEFGTSSVSFDVSVRVESPWESAVGRSALNQAIWWAFKEASITIAFPQLDIHLDSSVNDALTGIAGAA
jgi:potassium efflux system protein